MDERKKRNYNEHMFKCNIVICGGNNMSKCPKCKSKNLKPYDKVKRLVKTAGGKRQWIDVQRYKCKKCNSIHRQLPDIIIPFKHYDADIIEGVQNGYITPETFGYEDYPCEQTMNRWIKIACAK